MGQKFSLDIDTHNDLQVLKGYGHVEIWVDKISKLHLSSLLKIGINHGGSLDVAKKMAELAVANGASIVKHQTHIPSEEMSKVEAEKIKPKGVDKSIWDVISSCALDLESEIKLKVWEIGGVLSFDPFSIKTFEFLCLLMWSDLRWVVARPIIYIS